MNTRLTFLSFSTVLLGFAATALLIKPGLAIAQQSDEVIQEIAVETTAVVTRNVKTPLEELKASELSRAVSYSDLDLTLHKDVVELEKRIYASAKEVCTELADMRPRLRKPEPTCIRKAVDSASKKADEIIAEANESDEVFAAAY